MSSSAAWVAEQKKEDIFEEIINNSKKTNLQHLRSVGWNGFPDRLRAPSWQLLLQYLPATTAKRKSSLRRKRNEYHKHITKFYFEFDFVLTDRKLAANCSSDSTMPRSGSSKTVVIAPTRSNSESKSEKKHKEKDKDKDDTQSKRRGSTTRKGPPSFRLLKELSNQNLLPLFSQPHSQDKKEVCMKTRLDTLLLQIRHDIDQMVSVPTSSSAAFKSSKRLEPTDVPPSVRDYNGKSATTKNRVFSNKLVKESLERIIYLWSIRVNEKGTDSSAYSSRYVTCLVDIVYPLYLTNLHGYIWETHVQTSSRVKAPSKGENVNKSNSGKSTLRFIDNDDGSDVDIEDDATTAQQNKIYEDEDRKMRIKRCQDLTIGLGIDDIPEEILEEIEADTYWCLENLMSAIQDFRQNDAFAQPKNTSSSDGKQKKTSQNGLQGMLILIEKVTERKDPELHKHLKKLKVEYLWFAFRWLNSLHVRDMNEPCILRLWDTCMCEEAGKESGSYFTNFGFSAKRAKKRLHLVGFLNFQVYICSALLHRIRDRVLSQRKMEGALFELRNPSLETWQQSDIEILVSEAYLNQETFRGSEEQLLASATVQYGEDTLTTWVQRCHWPPRRSASKRG